MQSEKSAVESAKETAANIAASAKSGMEKTKAVIEEKVDRFSTSDPVDKDMATLRKEDKIRQAELKKMEAYSQNAAAANGGTESYTASGATTGHTERTGTESYITDGATTGHTESTGSYANTGGATAAHETGHEAKPVSAVPGHGTTISPSDHVTEGQYNVGTTVSVMGSQYPVGTNTGSGITPGSDPKAGPTKAGPEMGGTQS